MHAIVAAHERDIQMIDTLSFASISKVRRRKGGQIDVWVAREAGSRRRSTR
jgi:hypothetical protein